MLGVIRVKRCKGGRYRHAMLLSDLLTPLRTSGWPIQAWRSFRKARCSATIKPRQPVNQGEKLCALAA